MNIPHTLAQIIRRSPSLAGILRDTVRIVAREMGADVCSIYLIDPSDQRIRLAATWGLREEALGKVALAPGEGITGIVVAEMRSIAVEDAASHPAYRYFPETGEEHFHAYLGVPMAIRNRPVGALVVQSRERRVFTSEEIETLHTIAAQLVGVVENARLVEALDHPDRAGRYISELRRWNRGFGSSGPQRRTERDLVFTGNPASPGIAIGKAMYRGGYDVAVVPAGQEPVDAGTEEHRLSVAIDKTRADILRIQDAAEKETDEEHAVIFASHLLLLNDPTLLERLAEQIREGQSAPRAVDTVFAEIEAQLGSVGDVYLQERAEDIRDLRNRILSYLIEGGVDPASLSEKIIVAPGISPSLVVELKVQGARGIVTERGGTTSHGALLARAMGVPAVTGVEGLLETMRTGDDIIVDGGRGRVILRPSPRTVVRHRRTAERLAAVESELLELSGKSAVSPDGHEVELLANIGLASEVRQAVRFGAKGVGLYRTEFPFMVREDFPTREEQVRIYRRVINAFPEGPIIFRILDLGGDKYHPRITRPDEPNPALGYRSIRLMLDHPEILLEQVRAFLQVAGDRQVGILVPMVSTAGELRRTRELVEEAAAKVAEETGDCRPRPLVGPMIEVPAAVELAADLAADSDFFSIGTNDLIQFTLAVDRENSRVAPFGDAYHPAILRMVRRTIEGGHEAGIPVSCCGELASIPRLALLLAAMGIDSLSLTPKAIPAVKAAIRATPVEPVRERLDEVLRLSEGNAIRAWLEERIPSPAAVSEPGDNADDVREDTREDARDGAGNETAS